MPKTLLVVDDSVTICQAVRHALTGEDWTVVAAANRTDALEFLKAQTPDAVLCDVSLADADGYEVCRSIRTASGDGGPPVILMGAKVSEAGARAAGASATLPKPFGSSELVDAVQTALEESELELSLEELSDSAEVLTLEPIEAVPQWQRPAGLEEVDIIDLSGEDEYTDLEVIEGLDPIGVVARERPTSAPGDFEPAEPMRFGAPAPRRPMEELGLLGDRDFEGIFGNQDTPTAPPGNTPVVQEEGPFDEQTADSFTLDLEDGSPVFPEPEEAIAPPSVRLDATPTSASGEFSFDALEFDRRLDAAAAAPEGSEWLEREDRPVTQEPGPAEPPRAKTSAYDAAAAARGASEAPEVAIEHGVGLQAISETAERTVREALEATLSAEKLHPVVEAVVERVVWDVVPVLAERLIRETIEKLRNENPPA
jgi:CheY-like chemotaxis protein